MHKLVRKANNPSCGWSNIWTARSVLSSGLQRTIGTGAETKVWDDCWIPEDMARTAYAIGDVVDMDLKVHHLINHENMSWNETLIRELIAHEDVPNILATMSTRLGRKYGYNWRHTKSVSYTVWAGYERRNLTEPPVVEPSVMRLK